MTLRYAHLSARHQSEAVQRLNVSPGTRRSGTKTATRTATKRRGADRGRKAARVNDRKTKRNEVGRGRIELPTRRFSVCCSTD
jgi:hypothetical protein